MYTVPLLGNNKPTRTPSISPGACNLCSKRLVQPLSAVAKPADHHEKHQRGETPSDRDTCTRKRQSLTLEHV